MSLRSHLAVVAVLSLVACQSVRTEDEPYVSLGQASDSPTPSALGQPVSLTLGPSTPTPAPTAAPKKIAYSSVEGVGRTIAITFDDGPSEKLTPMLLDMLKQRGIHATFFVVGQNAAEFPDILRRMEAEGHEIGNHSWNHPQLTRMAMAGVDSQIQRTNAAIRAAVGHDPVLLRPPYGATSVALDKHFAQTYGLKVILWSVDPLDWKYRNSARVEKEILSQTKPGGIILSHDIHATTVAAMPDTLDALLAKGYKFVTVSQLIAMEGTQAGEASPKSDPTPYTSSITVPTPTPQATPAAAQSDGSETR